MKNKLLLFSLIPLLAFSSCSDNEKGDSGFKTSYDLTFNSMVMQDAEGNPFSIDYTLHYKDSYFKDAGTKFNKKLCVLSLGATLTHSDKAKTSEFYSTLGFENLYLSSDYDSPLTKDSVLYVFGYKDIGEDRVFSIGVNGFEYGPAWENNLMLAKTGNAIGFQSASDILKASFKAYFEENKGESNKLWVSGYSRSAAISGIFLEEILDEELVEEKKVYSYLFEAPKVMVEENVKPHPSIRNIINSHDFIVNALPSEYGFIRPGIEIDIYNENVDSIVNSFDERLSVTPFAKLEDYYKDEPGLIRFVLSDLLLKEGTDGHKDMSTRSNYVDNYQGSISYMVGLVFSLKSETLTKIEDDVVALGWGAASLLVGDGLYDFLKGELDATQEAYDDDKLHTACTDLVGFVTNVSPMLVALALSNDFINSLTRIIEFHAPEVELPLLLKFRK